MYVYMCFSKGKRLCIYFDKCNIQCVIIIIVVMQHDAVLLQHCDLLSLCACIAQELYMEEREREREMRAV